MVKVKKILVLATVVMMLTALVIGSACAGKQGVGIESIEDNGDGSFTITLTDGSTFTSSDLTGPKGDKGDTGAQGPQGIQGPAGTMPVMYWHQVAAFTGVGSGTAGSFSVPADDFRLRYDASTESDYAFFAVNIYGTTTAVAGVIWESDFTAGRADVEYIRDGRQQFELEVYAANLTGWNIYVEVLY